METGIKKLCGNCFFFVKHPGNEPNGDCRQLAPIPVPIITVNPLSGELKVIVQSMNPAITADYSCGKFQEAPDGERVAVVDDPVPAKRITSVIEGARKPN